MKEKEFQQLLFCSQDPHRFLTGYIKTLDPVRGITAFPDWPHLRKLTAALQRHPRLLVIKSRQMMATWTAVSLLLHRALFGREGIYLLLSRNERSARELLDRLRFVISGLPEFMRLQTGANSSQELEFVRRRVRILSLPATPDTPRMHSPAGVIWDEMAFTPNAEEIWTALKPALDSGGFFWGISSSGGPVNTFARLAQHPQDFGLEAFWLHYSDHPDRGPDWVAEAKKGLTPQRWAREYEISFESAEDRVYVEFQQRTHVLGKPWEINRNLPVYRTVDFGFYHPVVLYLQQDIDDRIVVFAEWIGHRATIQDLIDSIRRIDAEYGIDERNVLWTACDPAGHSPGDTGVSPIERLKRAGIKVRARASKIEEGIDLLREVLRDRSGAPGLVVSPAASRTITDFLGYRLREDGTGPEKDNVHDHTMDALRYFVVNLLGRKRDKVKVSARVGGI